jgi:3-isopropylmalate/(R)-2-methylmalate dehydratase small subunit
LLTCKNAALIEEGEQVALDISQSAVVRANGQRLACDPIPDFLMAMVQAGGLLPQLKLRLQQERASQ